MKRLLILLMAVATLMYGETPYQPQYFVTAGGGVVGYGLAESFTYLSYSARVATGTYTTQITEFTRKPGGAITMAERAGLFKILWQPGPFDIGVGGDAGVAIAATAGLSLSEQGFVSYRFRKTPLSLVFTGRLINQGGKNVPVVTLGLGWGIK